MDIENFTAQKLLDKIVGKLQAVPPNPPLSETYRTYLECVKMLDDALHTTYKKGCTDTEEKLKQLETDKLKKQN